MSFKKTPVPPNWRDEFGLQSKTEYKKRFALWPTICTGNERIWLKYYYKENRLWSSGYLMPGERDYFHVDYIANISEAEYIVRKLTEGI